MFCESKQGSPIARDLSISNDLHQQWSFGTVSDTNRGEESLGEASIVSFRLRLLSSETLRGAIHGIQQTS